MIDQPIANFMNSSVLQGEDQTSLFELVSRMQSTRQSAFVVCDDGVPVGVVTERDAIAILKGALAGESFEDTKACDVMASPVHTLPQSSFMGEDIQIMNDRGFRRVPIVDDKNQLVGIVNLTELQTAMNGALERRGRDLEIAVMARTAELQAANAKLEQLSLCDGLTGLLNRRAMAAKLSELHSLCQRYGNWYLVILLDIDHFRLLHDNLGHLKSDEILEQIAASLEDSVRISPTRSTGTAVRSFLPCFARLLAQTQSWLRIEFEPRSPP
jgi:CBS domain-containing protein